MRIYIAIFSEFIFVNPLRVKKSVLFEALSDMSYDGEVTLTDSDGHAFVECVNKTKESCDTNNHKCLKKEIIINLR